MPALLGAGAWLSGIVLTGAAGWLLTRAAALPPVLTLSTAVVLVRASAIARPLLRYLERLVSHEVALRRLGSRRAKVYASLIPRVPGVSFHRGGELLTRVVDDVDAHIDGLLRGRLPVASAGLALVTGLAAATTIAPPVGLVLLVGLIVSAVVAPGLAGLHARRLDAATSAATVAMRDAVVDTIDGLEELASRGDAVALSVPDRRSRVLSRIEARVARTAGAAIALAHLGWGATVAATAVVVGAAGLAPTTAAVLLLATVAIGEAVLVLPDAAVARHRAAGARTRLAALTAPEPAVGIPKLIESVKNIETTECGLGVSVSTDSGATQTRPAPSRPVAGTQSAQLRSGAKARGNLAVRGLVAGWDPRREPALRGVDLIVPAGSRVAIVGPSGCGKSTLAAVLVRLLAPREGTITLDGTGVLTPPALHLVCLVGDDADHVFASTVRENLRLARPEATDDELHAVLTRVRLDSWLAELPHGLDTWLGAAASTVSGGQRRRLAMARALLAEPDLLVLDEPTEGLDAATGSALLADLLAAGHGRTVLLLAHRNEGLQLVDTILELVDGRLHPAFSSTHVPDVPHSGRVCPSSTAPGRSVGGESCYR